MKNIFFIFLVLFVVCDSSFGMAKKYSKDEQVQRTVHGAANAIVQGRIDTADSILTEGKRIVPAPKKPIDVKPLTVKNGKTTETIVVLPSYLANKKVVARDSQEFQNLLSDRQLLRQYQKGEEGWKKYSITVSDTIKKQQEDKDKLEEELKAQKARAIGFWGLIKVGIGLFVGLGALVLLVIALWLVSSIVGLVRKIRG